MPASIGSIQTEDLRPELKLATTCNVPVCSILKACQFAPMWADEMAYHLHSNDSLQPLLQGFFYSWTFIVVPQNMKEYSDEFFAAVAFLVSSKTTGACEVTVMWMLHVDSGAKKKQCSRWCAVGFNFNITQTDRWGDALFPSSSTPVATSWTFITLMFTLLQQMFLSRKSLVWTGLKVSPWQH